MSMTGCEFEYYQELLPPLIDEQQLVELQQRPEEVAAEVDYVE